MYPMSLNVTYRPATAAEILAREATAIRFGHKVLFRHFVVEASNTRAGNGVSHKKYGRAKIQVVDGAPFVRHHGKREPLTATVVCFADGRTMVSDLRIAGLRSFGAEG